MNIGAISGNTTNLHAPVVPLNPSQLVNQGPGPTGPGGSFAVTQAAMASQFNQVAASVANAQAENTQGNGNRQEAPGGGQSNTKPLTFNRRGHVESGPRMGSRVSVRA